MPQCKNWPSCSCGYSNGRKRQMDCVRRKRMVPDEGLKEPVRKFEDTFSAEDVILKMFNLAR